MSLKGELDRQHLSRMASPAPPSAAKATAARAGRRYIRLQARNRNSAPAATVPPGPCSSSRHESAPPLTRIWPPERRLLDTLCGQGYRRDHTEMISLRDFSRPRNCRAAALAAGRSAGRPAGPAFPTLVQRKRTGGCRPGGHPPPPPPLRSLHLHSAGCPKRALAARLKPSKHLSSPAARRRGVAIPPSSLAPLSAVCGEALLRAHARRAGLRPSGRPSSSAQNRGMETFRAAAALPRKRPSPHPAGVSPLSYVTSSDCSITPFDNAIPPRFRLY